jgi:proline iminopeptidase
MGVDYEQCFNLTNKKGAMGGGVSVVPISTPLGEFQVRTKRTGNDPDVALLLLHGGPGATRDCFLGFDSFLPAAGDVFRGFDLIFMPARVTRLKYTL